jgi:hypothetical protein
MKTIGNLASIFGVNAKYLMGETDDPTPVDSGQAGQNKINQQDDTYDSLAEINKLVKKCGIEDMGFFDIEQ